MYKQGLVVVIQCCVGYWGLDHIPTEMADQGFFSLVSIMGAKAERLIQNHSKNVPLG